MKKEGQMDNWGEKMTNSAKQYFVVLKKLIKEAVEKVENKFVKDFEKNS